MAHKTNRAGKIGVIEEPNPPCCGRRWPRPRGKGGFRGGRAQVLEPASAASQSWFGSRGPRTWTRAPKVAA